MFFQSEIAQYKEDVLTKSDKAKIKEEKRKIKKRLRDTIFRGLRFEITNVGDFSTI